GAIGVEEHIFGMALGEFGIGLGGERRPPELRAKSLFVDLIDQGPHIGIAVREFLLHESPVTVQRLPAIVDAYPGEAEFFDDRQRSNDLGRSKCAAVAPRAPDRLECRCWRRLQMNALRLHYVAISSQGSEVVSLVNHAEAAEGLDRFS